jgi:hypothetical protein
VATLSGLAYGNGTSAFTAATAAQVVAVISTTAVTNATNATNATNTAITDDTTTATTVYPTWVTTTTGNLPQKTSSTKLSFVPSTGVLTATSHAGSGSLLTGIVTSNVAGTGISVSGATGAVTITNSGVTSIVAGTGISISGGTGAVTVTNSSPATATALARAWVNWAGSDGSIQSSYNVSSVSRTGGGLYTINFTSTLNNANYAVTGTAQRAASNSAAHVSPQQGTTPTTSALYVATYEDSASNLDVNRAYVAIFST